MNNDDGTKRKILEDAQTIAVVGFSSNKFRAGYYVPKYLQEHGYRVIPVNPHLRDEVLGEKTYDDLKSIPDEIQVDLVQFFRRPEAIPPFIPDAIDVGAKAIWMQLGIENDAAAEMARQAGLDVVMDACMMVEHRKLI